MLPIFPQVFRQRHAGPTGFSPFLNSYTDSFPRGNASNCSPILNDLLANISQTHDSISNFSLFPVLTLEIRLIVWKLLLPRSRLITITLTEGESECNSTDSANTRNDQALREYLTKNALGNTISGGDNLASVTTKHRLSLLLQINREARQVALDFYRVHIRCSYNRCNNIGQPPQCIYLNPDLDILHIKAEGTSKNFADFIHDIRAYDPQGRGISNLAIGDQEQNQIVLPLGIYFLA